MVILFLLFLIQFSVACACLGVNREQQDQLAEQGWQRVHNSTRINVQEVFGCCGFDPKVDAKVPPPSCDDIYVSISCKGDFSVCEGGMCLFHILFEFF